MASQLDAPADPIEPVIPEKKAPDMFAAMDRAKTELRARVDAAEKSRAKPRVVTSKDVPLDVTIAVWDKVTDDIKYLAVSKTSKSVTVNTEYDAKIRLARSNGVNSRYDVDNPDRLVIAVAYPIFKDITVKKRQPKFELHDKVYTPYNQAFYTPQVLSRGSDYLSYLLTDAYTEVREKGIKSHAFPDRLLADIVDPYLVKSIAIIEHADSQIYGDDAPEQSVGRFLITLALNGEDAFNSSVSSAGARGLVQFMPGTYKMIAKGRPELGLIQDFTAAMSDHTNAVKAQMALLDENLDLMPKDVQALYLNDRGQVAPFLAAAYNGGTVRVRRSYAEWGADWATYRMNQLDVLQVKADKMDARIKQLKKLIAKTTATKELKQYKVELSKLQNERPGIKVEYATIKKSALHKETADYVSKLNKVYSMLSAGYFATPNAIDGGIGQTVATR
jgi:hypothetical protein